MSWSLRSSSLSNPRNTGILYLPQALRGSWSREHLPLLRPSVSPLRTIAWELYCLCIWSLFSLVPPVPSVSLDPTFTTDALPGLTHFQFLTPSWAFKSLHCFLHMLNGVNNKPTTAWDCCELIYGKCIEQTLAHPTLIIIFKNLCTDNSPEPDLWPQLISSELWNYVSKFFMDLSHSK